jgi:glycosyltransferase involved in cell wall biosynthesis
MKKVSYAITTHNEGDYFENLIGTLNNLLRFCAYEYEIVVVDDNSTDPKLLDVFNKNGALIKVHQHALNNDFATHKNFLFDKCNGDYIFNLDADELPPERVVVNFPKIVDVNPAVDVYNVTRINTVHGLTQRHVIEWGWQISSLPTLIKEEQLNTESAYFELLQKHDLIMHYAMGQGAVARVKYMLPIVNWPDPQTRICKNSPNIRWQGKVHERLSGQGTISQLPIAAEFAILHHKTISRQEQQNSFYMTIR